MRRDGLRIGYLIGQFPSSTHTFIWRDVCAIERMGVEVTLLSTRLPIGQVASHSWARKAIERTTYFVENPVRAIGAVLGFVVSNPVGVWKCIELWAALEGVSLKQRLAVIALLPLGARLGAICRSQGIAHVHVPFPAQAAYMAVFSKLLSGVPYSLGSHGTPSMFGSGLNLRIKWKNAAFGTAITPLLRESLKSDLGDDAPSTVVIAPMGVEVERFKRKEKYTPWSGTGPAFFFSCGRGVVDKGHLEAVQALAILVSQGIDAYLRIGGEFVSGSWFSEKLSGEIKRLGLERRVRLLGSVPEEIVIQELENCHVFVLATRDEGLGVAIMEAMAMQVPVVSTCVGGVPVLIDSGVHGILVRKESPGDLASAIQEVLRDPVKAAIMGRNGRSKIESQYTSDFGARAFVDELKQRYRHPH